MSAKVEWLRLVPDTLPPGYPESAIHFGVDPKKRDVYIHAEAAGLEIDQQLDAIAAGALVYYNPFQKPAAAHSQIESPYVSIDYLTSAVTDLPVDSQLGPLKAVVLAAYDSGLSNGESMPVPPL